MCRILEAGKNEMLLRKQIAATDAVQLGSRAFHEIY
jgi:hypothetical protein